MLSPVRQSQGPPLPPDQAHCRGDGEQPHLPGGFQSPRQPLLDQGRGGGEEAGEQAEVRPGHSGGEV